MNRSVDDVLSYLTGNADINGVSVEDCRKLVADNPYFPVTHFLLAKKMKGEANWESSRDVQKAAIYYSNPYWLQYQLTEKKIDDEFKELSESGSTEEEVETRYDADPPASQTDILTGTDLLDVEAGAAGANVESSAAIIDAALAQSGDQDEPHFLPGLTEQPSKELELEATNRIEEDTVRITENTNEGIGNADGDINTDSAGLVGPRIPIFAEVPHEAELEVTELEEEMAGVTHGSDTTTERFLEEAEREPENTDEDLQDEHDKMFQNIKAMLDASSEEADAHTNDVVVPIDPYYTIDYFASQGIKLELDKNPQDQLGQNLKKFTHWLRHMKKLGPEDATEVINRIETDADIQQIADSSNTAREVVTEAMASVLEKQGKSEKAIELYNKLSFLYPHKNAYFADKIKKLKGS